MAAVIIALEVATINAQKRVQTIAIVIVILDVPLPAQILVKLKLHKDVQIVLQIAVQIVLIIPQVVDAQDVLLVAPQVAKQPAKEVASMDVILFAVDNVYTHVAVHVLMCQQEVVVRHQHVLALVLPIVIAHVQWLVVQVASHNAFMALNKKHYEKRFRKRKKG